MTGSWYLCRSFSALGQVAECELFPMPITFRVQGHRAEAEIKRIENLRRGPTEMDVLSKI
jgi:hypothetical protein